MSERCLRGGVSPQPSNFGLNDIDPATQKIRTCQMLLEKQINILRSTVLVNRELMADELESIQNMLEN